MRVAVLRALGDGGLQDPKTGTYISSKRDTIAPYSDWAESLVNHDKVKLVELLEGSNYADYVSQLAEAKGDEDAALQSYRKRLPSADTKAEKVLKVENAADLEQQESEMPNETKRTRKTGETTVAKTEDKKGE